MPESDTFLSAIAFFFFFNSEDNNSRDPLQRKIHAVFWSSRLCLDEWVCICLYMCSCKWVCMGLSTLFTKLHPGATQQRWRMKCDGSVHRSLNPNSICVCAKHTHTHNTHAHTHTHTHRSSLTAPVSLPSCSFLSSSLSTVSSVWLVHDGLWCLFLSLPNKVVKIQLSEQSVLPF